jgi:polar amino acid transport system substrate-binding protein
MKIRPRFHRPDALFTARAAIVMGIVLASGLCHAVGAQHELKNVVIGICDDMDEWPPYIYYERSAGKKSDKLIGYSIDVIKEIFARHQIRYTVALIPWARCLAEVKAGTTYQMTLNPSYSPERDRDFWMTRPYYAANNYYYFSRRHYPHGLPVKGIADLKRYRACGILGNNYTMYGFQRGELDQGTNDFPALIAKLDRGRCDIFMEKYEVMLGFLAIGKRYLADPDLGRAPIPGMSSTPFHMAVSRAYPEGKALRDLIDRELEQMETSGRLATLLKNATPN